jgi:predicted amidohydrolase YtcJ
MNSRGFAFMLTATKENGMRNTLVSLAALILLTGLSSTHAQEVPDTIYLNGKIVTVDDYFSIEEAVAVRGNTIQAVGSDQEIISLKGDSTLVLDLQGRTVIPGLIDNHNHVVRATEYWPNDARLDGVTSRSEALKILKAKADELPPGEWLMSLGGWAESQFSDSRRDFTLAELDAISRDRPVFVQSVYDHAYGNTAWFSAMGISLTASKSEQEKAEGLASYVLRDGQGNATGRVNGGFPMIAVAISRFPTVPAEKQAAAIKTSMAFLNSIGLTAIYDPGGVGIKQESYERIRQMSASEGIPVRVFHTLNTDVPKEPEQAREFIKRIKATKPFQGDAAFDLIAMGEIYYGPFHWDNNLNPVTPTDEDIAIGKEILMAAAAGGWPVQTHAMQPQTMDLLFDVFEEVNQQYPMRQLRWSITHADNISPDQFERARHLGLNLQLRSTPVLGNRASIVDKFGDAAYQMPPLRLVQESGIPFGLGTDGTKANQINPFVTLWWAVSGKALNGDVVTHQTLSREEALIAHTRSNAYLMFQEARLGSIRPGLLADMLVLDRDYLSVPVDEIKDIRPVATIVDGEIVFGEL